MSKRVQKDIKEWADKALNPREGYRQAHNFVRGTAKAPPLPEEAKNPQGGPIIMDQDELAEHFQAQWGKLWTQRDAEDHLNTIEKLRDLQRQSLEQQLEEMCVTK